jgi:hypothetical protein
LARQFTIACLTSTDFLFAGSGGYVAADSTQLGGFAAYIILFEAKPPSHVVPAAARQLYSAKKVQQHGVVTIEEADMESAGGLVQQQHAVAFCLLASLQEQLAVC